jgi:dihydrolipoamide dehydrogenase
MLERYDIAIIGAGPGGYVAAIRAGQLGRRVVVVEREPTLGGVCLNWGCIPTKALIKNAEMVRFVQDKAPDYGITVSGTAVDWGVGVQRSRRVVRRMTKGVEGLFKKNNVAIVRGAARFVDDHTLTVELSGDGGEAVTIDAENVIVATGSRSRLLPGMVADGERILTSRHAVALDAVPRRLLIMGAGAIGMEFAYIFRSYGAEVTVIEMLDSVLPLEDREAGQVVARSMAKGGIKFRTSTRVESVTPLDDGVRLVMTAGGKEEAIEGDRLLVAIGRAPNSEDLNLAAAGVLTERGFIAVDADRRTSAPSVYAIGDVVGAPMLAHKASHEAVQVVEHLAGLETHPFDATLIPSCTYCQPQVASIGRTEPQAREAGYDVKVSKFPFQAIGKPIAIGDYEGWVKIVADAKYGEILGATIVGPDATEIIHELVVARSAELTADDLAATIHAHPTLSEAIHEAALGVVGVPIHI